MFLTFPLHDVDQTSKSLLRREVDGAGEVTQQVEMLGPQDFGNLGLIPRTHVGGENGLLQGVLGSSRACCGVNLDTQRVCTGK